MLNYHTYPDQRKAPMKKQPDRLKRNAASQIMFHPNRDRVVLLVHAFRATPEMMSDLSDHLYNRGFSIYNLRLPGHGLVDDSAIFRVTLNDWRVSVENVYLDLQAQFKEVCLIGFSLGACLFIDLLAKTGASHKTVLISPCLRFKYLFRTLLTGILRFFQKKITPHEWDCTIRHEYFNRFIQFIPVPRIWDIYKLVKSNNRNLNRIKAPVLCFLSSKDNDIPYSVNKAVARKAFTRVIDMQKSKHFSLNGIEHDIVTKAIDDFLTSPER